MKPAYSIYPRTLANRAVLTFCVAVLGATLASVPQAAAQLSITNTSSSYVIDFSTTISGVNNGTFNGTGFQPSPTAGQLDSDAWAVAGMSDGSLAFGGTQTSGDFARGSSFSATGGIFGVTDSGDTFLAVRPTGDDFTPGSFTLRVQNTSGSLITGFDFAYNIMVRNDQARANSFNFSWSLDNTSYTALTDLNYTSPAASTGTTWSSVARSTNFTSLSLANSAYIYFRWTGDDVSGSGSRDGFGLDDISLSSFTTGSASTDYFWAGDGLNLGGSGTWNTSNTNWSATNSPVLGIAWDSGKKAIFTNTSGTVTVSTVTASNGMQFASTGYVLTNGTLTLGGTTLAANTIATDIGVTTTIGTTLAGTTGLTKSGAGTLVLSGANSFSGGIGLNAGAISVGAANNLGDAGNDIVFGGGTLVTTASFETGSGMDFSGSGTIDIAGGTILTNNGAFNMSALTLTNTGTLVLNGATRTLGTFAFTAAGTVNGSGAVTVTTISAAGLTNGTATINPDVIYSAAGDKNLEVGTGGNLVLNGNISGTTGRTVKLGAGTLVVNGTNSTGGFRFGAAGSTNGGTLVLGNAQAVGTNTFQFNHGTLIASAPMTITNALSIGGRESAVAVVGGTNAIEFTGPVSWFNGGSNAVLQVNNESTMSGVITNAAGDVDLVVGGAGTLTMSGSSANVFTNELVITNTLTVNLNKSANTTAVGGNVTIHSGATLLVSASGQVADTSVVTLSGGTIQRASGVNETFGDLNLTADSVLDYTSGTQGTLEFGIYESDLAPDFKLTLNNFFQGNKLIFANDLSAYIDASYVGTSFDNSYFAINGMAAAGFTSSWNGSTFTITAIPEPGTVAAAAGLLGLMLWPARRRLLALATRRA